MNLRTDTKRFAGMLLFISYLLISLFSIDLFFLFGYRHIYNAFDLFSFKLNDFNNKNLFKREEGGAC
jgi:hypothetical protein